MDIFNRRQFLALGGAAIASPALVGRAAAALNVKMGVGGKSLLYYLPLTIAERKGFFKDFGLDAEINDFAGGSKSLQALVGGSVDIVAGAYEHTIRMQAKGQDIRAVIEMLRFPTIVIGVRKALVGKVKSAKDFKGLKIGVTAPGSSTYITVLHAMKKAGLSASDASFIGVGGGASAVAAMKKGEIDIISHLDPVIAKLEADGDIVALIDTRTEKGTFDLFGGTNPASCLYVKQDFITRKPEVVQAAVNGIYKALRWINKASPEDIAAAVPEQYLLGDKALYLRAVKSSQAAYSETGLMAPAAMKSVYDTLKALDKSLATTNVDVNKTFVSQFVIKAAQTVK
jgi:NitT/TauT family transport system substrate-binding protein